MAGDTAGVRIFVDAVRHVGGGDEKIDWMMAEGNCDGQRSALGVMFIAMHASMFARRHVQPHMIAAVDHDAVSADVDPALFWIAGDHQIVGADVTSAVELMPARHGKF